MSDALDQSSTLLSGAHHRELRPGLRDPVERLEVHANLYARGWPNRKCPRLREIRELRLAVFNQVDNER